MNIFLIALLSIWTIGGAIVFFAYMAACHEYNQSIKPLHFFQFAVICGPIAWIFSIAATFFIQLAKVMQGAKN